MFTSPLPLMLDRYQIRFMGAMPIPERADRALEGFVQSGMLDAAELGQATNRDGVPSWNVSLLIRERDGGRAMPVTVRVDSPVTPHEDIARGSYVTFDTLFVEWSGRGRHAPRFSYLGMRTTEPGHVEGKGTGTFMQFAVSAADLLVEVASVTAKKDRELAKPAVVKAAREQGKDLDDLLPQATNKDGIPKWSLDSIIVTADGSMFVEQITVVSPEMPNVSGPISIDVLLLAGGESGQYPNQRPWVSLGAPNITTTPAAPVDRGNRRNRPEPAPEQNQEHVEANA